MAPKLPKGKLPGVFGFEQTEEVLTKSSKGTRLKKDDAKQRDKDASLPEKKRVQSSGLVHDLTEDEGPTKRAKVEDSLSSILVKSEFDVVSSFVSEKDVFQWKTLDKKAQASASVKAAAELLIYSLGRASTLEKEQLQLQTLKNDNDMMARQLKSLQGKWDSDKKAKDKEIANLKKKIEDQTELVKSLNEACDELNTEKINMEARLEALEADKENSWEGEKSSVKAKSYEAGFKNYLSGFIAVDPEYDFSKFDASTQKWISDFRIDAAEEIEGKRKKLASLTEESDGEDASLAEGEFTAVSPHTASAPALQIDQDGIVQPSSQPVGDPQPSGTQAQSDVPAEKVSSPQA